MTTELQVSFCTRQSAEIRILNCHMKLNLESSISLAINHYFGSKPRLGEVKTLIDNTTGQRSLFLDSSFFFLNSTRIFFRLKFQNFDLCLKSWHLLSIFFSFLNIYILQISTHTIHCIRCILQVLTCVLCFQHVFTIGIILSATERHTSPRDISFLSSLSIIHGQKKRAWKHVQTRHPLCTCGSTYMR